MNTKQRFLVMCAGELQYAIPFEQVSEVVGELKDYYPVPRSPVWCLGATRSAGIVVAVIDLAWYMEEEPEKQPENIVVLDIQSGGLALQVGRISSLILDGNARIDNDVYGGWLIAPGIKAELLDSFELVQEVTAAMSR